MEILKEVYKGKIPKDNYYIQISNDEKGAITIELESSINGFIYITFERYEAIRMLEERILLNDLFYTIPEPSKSENGSFGNVIYELEGGTFIRYLEEINEDKKRLNHMHNYVLVTMDYFIEIVTDVEPNFHIIKKKFNY